VRSAPAANGTETAPFLTARGPLGDHREVTERRKPPRNRKRATGEDPERPPRKKRKARKKKRAAKAKAPEEKGQTRGNRRIERPPSEPEIDLLDQPPPREPRWNLKERFPRFWRGAAMVIKLAVASACVAGGVSVYRLVHDYVMRAPAFAITELQVDGLERVEEEALLDVADIHLGDNVFRHDVEVLRERVLRHPWIATAEVDRRLPGRVSITVTEHEPVAVLALRGLYLVSADGTVFKSVELGDPVDLPVVSGLDENEFVSNRAFRTAVLLEVVALMHDYRSAGLWRREPIAEIRVDPTGDLSLRVGEDAMLVRLGRGPHRNKLRRLRQILDRLDRSESRAEYVYLDNARRPDRVTVRLREEPEPPASTDAEAS
jgi:cell division protein FtsQ